MGCSFTKIQPAEPKKSSTSKRGYKITPDNMRKIIKSKMGKDNATGDRRSLINYSYKNFVGNLDIDKNPDADESKVSKVKQKITKKEEKKIEKKTKGGTGTMGSLNNFLSLQQIKKPIKPSSINKKALYFKSLPKEIKELRFQSLKVKEMEELSKIYEEEKRSFVRRRKPQYKKSCFFKFKRVNASNYQDRTLPVMGTLHDFFEQEMEKGAEDDAKKEIPKGKPNFTLPRIQTTYVPSKKLKAKNSEKVDANHLMSHRFKDIDLGKVKPGASKSVDQNKSHYDESFSRMDDMDTSIAKILRVNNREKELRRIQEYKNWAIIFDKKHKSILERSSRARSPGGKYSSRKRSHFGGEILPKDNFSKGSSVLVEGIVDDFGNTLKCGASSYRLSENDMSNQDSDNLDNDSLYDSVYGLKGY